METPNDTAIIVKGARVHNLKNISITLPRDAISVITGPSGSGKSSLAFDTIYAEGQRRYVESLSSYARQFLDQLSKPEVESISGLSPTISIEQKTTSSNPRSTVGTLTEVYDYLRLLYARIAEAFCYSCGKKIQSQTAQQMADFLITSPDGTKISILAPIVRERKGEYQKELLGLRQQGFSRVRIDGETHDLSEEFSLDKQKKHTIEVYVDRIVVKKEKNTELHHRLEEAVELALRLADGIMQAEVVTGKEEKSYLFSQKFSCPDCHVSYPPPEPRSFSFNSPMGACSECDGLGTLEVGEEETETDDDSEIHYKAQDIPCPECLGQRLRKESLFFKIGGKSISDLTELSIERLSDFFERIKLSDRQTLIAHRVVLEIRERLRFLREIGVSYLNLGRSAGTLSGGETQRIRLASQLGSHLVGVIYVLDEPSIGLHQSDNKKLLDSLKMLRDRGNTVLVVEHDKDTMEIADYIVDLGPGAGELGGELVSLGTYQQVLKSKNGLTGKYLSGELSIPVPAKRRKAQGTLEITHASKNNLKNVNLELPLGTFTCVTGVSGSGKSTLVLETLYPALLKHFYKVEVGNIQIKKITGLDLLDKVIDIDQSPIGRTPRSNPATYTGLFSLIRDLFAHLPESQIRGFKPGRFSFNVQGGRCEVCEGDGEKKIVMHFLPDVYVPCEGCHGKRYNSETLEIRYRGKTIADVLQMTASEALPFFDAHPQLKSKLAVLNEVGLGYVRLGQSSTTLSGGEAQRIKLAKELSKRATGKTLYLLDEPTTGLHFDDVRKLVELLQKLVDQGNTVVVIEHNLDLIKVADHVIDMGPKGGEGGGEIIASGTPEQIVKISKSSTGSFLKPYL